MKALEEETRDLQSQDEQVQPFYMSSLSFRRLDPFEPLCSVSHVTLWLLVSVQAQTTLKVYSMNSDRLHRNLETAGEENLLLQESNSQVR